MSDRPEDRLLEETFRPILARALGAGTALRVSHEDAGEGAPRPLPMVGIAARRAGDDWNFTASDGSPASAMELRLECRVDAAAAESAQTAETLAASVKAAVLAAAEEDFPLWDVIDAVEFAGTERGMSHGARFVAHTVTLTALRAL